MSGVDAAGNPEALRAHKEASQRQTRQELELALARLRNGNPRRVKRGAAITQRQWREKRVSIAPRFIVSTSPS